MRQQRMRMAIRPRCARIGLTLRWPPTRFLAGLREGARAVWRAAVARHGASKGGVVTALPFCRGLSAKVMVGLPRDPHAHNPKNDAVTSGGCLVPDLRALIARLSTIDPFDIDTHPIGQIGISERTAREIIGVMADGLQPCQKERLSEAYAYGLKDGFYGLGATIVRDVGDNAIHAGDLTAIALVGLRHGRALREWWSSNRQQRQERFSRSYSVR